MHNVTQGLIIALTTIACSGGNKYISESDFDGYEYVDTGDTAENVEDTSTPGETDTQDTEDTEETELCKNDYHPIHLTGWSKTFTATYEGNSAVATEEGIGTVEWNGQTVYAYKDTMSAQGQDTIGTPITTGWDTTVYVSCGFEGQEGMFMVGWEGTASQCTFCFFTPTTYAVDATLSPYRRYLSPEFAVGAEGSWDYDYSLSIDALEDNCGDGQDNDSDGAIDAADPDCQTGSTEAGGGTPQNQTEQVTGSYLDAGFQDITILAGTAQAQTVRAYKVVNTVTQTDQFGQPSESYIEQYWVKGLGMVKEDFIDANDNITLSKELSAMNGLTVIQ